MLEKHEKYSESSPIIIGTSTTVSQQCGAYDNSAQDIGHTTSGNTNSLDVTENRQTHVGDMEMEEKKRFSFSKISNRKKSVLCLCTFANFLSAAAYALLGPFFPLEAEKKGMNLTMIGFVYGLYQLVVFLTSPLMGNFMTRIGIKFMFISGIFVGGCSAILFGLLDKVPGGTIFLVMCMLVRSVEAFGFAAFMTASMTIVSGEFEDYAGSVLALLKVATGMGGLVGPVLAGVLYDIGGFGLPFYCLAVPILLNGAIIYSCLPDVDTKNTNHKRKTTIFNLLRSPLVVVSMMSVFVGVSGTMFFLSTLAIHLKPFGLSSSVVGAMYTIGPVFYASMAPLWGYITDVKDKQAVLIVYGHYVSCIAWLLVGPSPLVPFIPSSVVSIGIGFFVLGMCLGCLIIPPIKCMVYGAYDLNYERNADTFAMISGLYNSVYAFGGFFGPFVGGILAQQYGFPLVYTGIGLANIAMFFVALVFFSLRYFKHREQENNSQRTNLVE